MDSHEDKSWSEGDGRSFFVKKNGTLQPLPYDRKPETKNTANTLKREKPRMKIIVSNTVAKALQQQLVFPGNYIQHDKSNSMNLRDHVSSAMLQKHSFPNSNADQQDTLNINRWK